MAQNNSPKSTSPKSVDLQSRFAVRRDAPSRTRKTCPSDDPRKNDPIPPSTIMKTRLPWLRRSVSITTVDLQSRFATCQDAASRIRKTCPSNDPKKNDPTPPSTIMKTKPSWLRPSMSRTPRRMVPTLTGQPSRIPHTSLSTQRSRHPSSSVVPSIPAIKAEVPPAPCRSPRTTRGGTELPLFPLDIKFVKIGVAHLRGIKRSAAHIDDAANEDEGEGGEPGPRDVVTPVGRRVRFQTKSPPESRPKQRRRVGDTAETAPDELWVAVGEDRCKPCKLVGREVCKPQWNGSEPCKSCVFCTDQTWSCNPPDSWVEKAVSKPLPKQTPPKSQVATDDAPAEAGGSSKTAGAAPPTTKVVGVKRQSGRQKAIKECQAILDETRDLDRRTGETMLLAMVLCTHFGITPWLLPGFNNDAAARAARQYLRDHAQVTTEFAALFHDMPM